MKKFFLTILFFTSLTSGIALAQSKSIVTPNASKVIGLSYPLYVINAVELNSGTVVVLTGQDEKFIKVFKNGAFKYAFGKKGPGPYEFKNPTNICSFSKSIAVFDFQPGRNKIVIFNLKGNPMDMKLMREAAFAYGFACYKGNFVVTLGQFTDSKRNIYSVKKGESILTYTLRESEITLHPSAPMNSFSLTAPFQPKFEWEMANVNQLWIWNGKGRNVYKISFQKDTLAAITIMINNKIPISEKDINAWINQSFPRGENSFGIQNFYGGVREKLFEYNFRNYYPLIMDIKNNPNGGFWILRADKTTGQLWVLIRKNKNPLKVKFPAGRAVMDFGNMWIAARNANGHGRQTIELYKYEEIIK